GHVADDEVGAGAMRALVLGQQPRICLHVVVEEEEELAAGGGGTGVAGLGGALVLLRDHGQRERRLQRPQRLGGAVAGAVVDDDDLEVLPGLLRERSDVAEHPLAPPVGRDDDAESHAAVAGSLSSAGRSWWTRRRASGGARKPSAAPRRARGSSRPARARLASLARSPPP